MMSLDQAFASEVQQLWHGWLEKVVHCLRQLPPEQVWLRFSPEHHSVGNLVLHLCGHVRQRMLTGLAGAEEVRNREAEFQATTGPAPQELIEQLQTVVNEACEMLNQLPPETWLEPHDYAMLNRTDSTHTLGVVLRTLVHFSAHAQEIITLTRLHLGARYQFLHSSQK